MIVSKTLPPYESSPLKAVVERVRYSKGKLDLTDRQKAVLTLVAYAQTDKERTVRHLHTELNVSKPVITRALNALSQHSFVRRVRDMADKRNVFLHVEPAGSKYIREFA